MSNNFPILIIQMQRMGDLILTFPLINYIIEQHPNNPLWVVGEPFFYKDLQKLLPKVRFFSLDEILSLKATKFKLVINLSHRPEALELAGMLDSEELLGQYINKDNQKYINGNWHIYTASLVQNNTYNHYHWSNLFMLDSLCSKSSTTYSHSSNITKKNIIDRNNLNIGIFLGASEASKHPDASFWIELINELILAGHYPLIFGGEGEIALAKEVERNVSKNKINLCAKFNLLDLYNKISELDLFISPDTGPMHLASLTNTPVINLSMGQVNPWETGPFYENNYIFQAALNCIGCWQCKYSKTYCKQKFKASEVVDRINQLTKNTNNLPTNISNSLNIYQTSKNQLGLYHLKQINLSINSSTSNSINKESANRKNLTSFWYNWFAYILGISTSSIDIKNNFNQIPAKDAHHILNGIVLLSKDISLLIKNKNVLLINKDHWKKYPKQIHPLSGYLQMMLQNSNKNKNSLTQSLDWLELLKNFLIN